MELKPEVLFHVLRNAHDKGTNEPTEAKQPAVAPVDVPVERKPEETTVGDQMPLPLSGESAPTEQPQP